MPRAIVRDAGVQAVQYARAVAHVLAEDLAGPDDRVSDLGDPYERLASLQGRPADQPLCGSRLAASRGDCETARIDHEDVVAGPAIDASSPQIVDAQDSAPLVS